MCSVLQGVRYQSAAGLEMNQTPHLYRQLVRVSPGVLTLCSVPPTGFGGGKYVSFEDRHWHHNCFNCARCNTSLVGKGFIPDNDEILCRDCSSDL